MSSRPSGRILIVVIHCSRLVSRESLGFVGYKRLLTNTVRFDVGTDVFGRELISSKSRRSQDAPVEDDGQRCQREFRCRYRYAHNVLDLPHA